jgi:hypothetical protein
VNTKLLSDEEAVKAVYPDAELVGYHDGACAIFSREAARAQDTGYLGWGQATFNRSSTQANREAWADARSKLPTEPKLPDTFEEFWAVFNKSEFARAKLGIGTEFAPYGSSNYYVLKACAEYTWYAGRGER